MKTLEEKRKLKKEYDLQNKEVLKIRKKKIIDSILNINY